MDIISAIGSINALIIAFLIYRKKTRSISDNILIIWVLNFALHFAILFLNEKNLLLHETNWGFILGIVLVLHTPFLYIYTKSLTDKNFLLNLKTLANYGVIFIYIIAFIPNLLMSTEERSNLVYNKEGIPFQAFIPMFTLLFCQIYFLIRTLIILLKHQYNIKREFSYEDKINLVWIKRIVYGFASIILLSFVAYGLVSAKIISIYHMDWSISIINMILFFFIAYYGYQQKSVYRSDQMVERKRTENKENKVAKESATNQPTSYNKEESNEIHPKIVALTKIMANEKLYLDPELSIGNLANQLGVHSHQLSKLINTELNKNFFEFVNEYRVEEYKKLIVKPENKHISILGLAMDAGFNSKATFNRFFKNTTGLTPSEFRESYKF